MSTAAQRNADLAAFSRRLKQRYGLFTIGFLLFAFTVGLLEVKAGLSRPVIGYAFLLVTLGLYALVGILNFTKSLDDYYVAGRRVPALFNGMATGADWMSAASFISMAGTVYLLGYDGLAYILGWTGGTCSSPSCSRRTSASSASSRSLTSSRPGSARRRSRCGSCPRSARSPSRSRM